jgi:hypothetical protein
MHLLRIQPTMFLLRIFSAAIKQPEDEADICIADALEVKLLLSLFYA